MFCVLLYNFPCLFNYLSEKFSDKKFLALASRKMRVISLENGKELLKFPDDLVSYSLIVLIEDVSSEMLKALTVFHSFYYRTLCTICPYLMMPRQLLQQG